MARIESNSDEVAAWLDAVLDGFEFTLPGEDQSLGRDLAGVAAQGMIDRGVPDAKGPDGSTWDPNEPKYAARKRRKYDADQPGILSGQMLSLESMMGETAVSADRVDMTYGTGEAATRARNGADLSDSEKVATDRQKAEYFTASGREFYGFDPSIEEAVTDLAAERWGEYLDEETK